MDPFLFLVGLGGVALAIIALFLVALITLWLWRTLKGYEQKEEQRMWEEKRRREDEEDKREENRRVS